MRLLFLEICVLKRKPEDTPRRGDSDVQLAVLKANIQVFGAI
jgi:hypothetical protein